MKIGIVGSGISGLGAAHYLAKQNDVTVFEAAGYAGGHTNTIQVTEERRQFPVDTGFIVFNDKTYPELLKLFNELNIAWGESDMSFSVNNRHTGLQWAGQNTGTVFAQKRNLFNLRFIQMLRQALRIFKEAESELNLIPPQETMRQYLDRKKYNDYFRRNFILPMGSAVWSTPLEQMLDFPALTFLHFFRNHGFLETGQSVFWRYVKGGSDSYVKRILENKKIEIRLNEPVRAVSRHGGKAQIKTDKGTLSFDKVIVACHAPQAVRICEDLSDKERNILSSFQYVPNEAILHTDESVMPSNRKAWASWNFKIMPDLSTGTVYWMNRLQSLDSKKNYFVSINEPEPVSDRHIIRKISYEHPLFDTKAILAQKEFASLNQTGPVYFCGAYTRYGFHEDGLMSGVAAAGRILNA